MNILDHKQRVEPKLDIIDGVGSSKSIEPIKKTLKEKTKKKIIDDKINKNYEKIITENKFDEIIKQSIEGIKLCLDYNQMQKEEYLKNHRCSYPGILPKLELIHKYNLYITMLGIIDYKIDELRQKDLETPQLTANKYDDLVMLKTLISKRQELVNEIIKQIKPNTDIEEVIKTCPTHSALSKLYEKANLEHSTYIDTDITYLATAYNNGYNMSKYDRYVSFEYKFDCAKIQISYHEKKLNNKTEKIKIRKR